MSTGETADGTEARVRALVMELAVAGGYDGPQPGPDADLAAIGFDSLLTVELVARLEDEFGVEIPDDRLTPGSFATVRGVAGVVDAAR